MTKHTQSPKPVRPEAPSGEAAALVYIGDAIVYLADALRAHAKSVSVEIHRAGLNIRSRQ